MDKDRGATSEYRIGDRVKLSERGRSRFPRTKLRTGIVIHVPAKEAGVSWVKVLFDGRVSTAQVHRSFIEHVTSGHAILPSGLPQAAVSADGPHPVQLQPRRDQKKRVVLGESASSSPASDILIRCPETARPVPTGLTTAMVQFKTLLDLEVGLECRWCGKRHLWRPKDAWLAQAEPTCR